MTSECQQLLDTTLPKQKVSGAFLQVAAIKLLVKLNNHDIDPLLLALVSTIVRVTEILYSGDSKRTPKTVLQLYNLTWLHHELCRHFLSNPKLQSRTHLFGIYLHDLVVHAPSIYSLVCMQSTNAESQERLFSQAKHIGLKATSRKPENVLPTILICMQARQRAGDCQQSIYQQDSMVSKAASKLSPSTGTFISDTFLSSRLSSWQAHLMRISSYLMHGEGVWWKREEEGFRFLDGVNDPDSHAIGPPLDHFRSKTLPDVYCKRSQDWDSILHAKVTLPSPSIRQYDSDGNYQNTSSVSLLPPFSTHISTHSQSELQSNLDSDLQLRSYTSATSTTSYQATTPSPLGTLHTTPVQAQATTPSPLGTLHTTPMQDQATTPSPLGTQAQATTPSPPDMLNTMPDATNTANTTQYTATRGSSVLMPTILFQNLHSSPKAGALGSIDFNQPEIVGEETSTCSSSNQTEAQSYTHTSPEDNASVAVMDVVSVQCSINSLVNDGTETLQTKAAKLVHKVIGPSSDLTRFDRLRLKLKEQLQTNQTPTTSEREEYNIIIAKLQSRILSLKYTTRDNLKSMEREYIVQKGLQLDQSNTKYKLLYKKLELVKTVLGVWSV